MRRPKPVPEINASLVGRSPFLVTVSGVARLLGYACIPTTEQHLDLQRDALRQAGCERVFADTASVVPQY